MRTIWIAVWCGCWGGHATPVEPSHRTELVMLGTGNPLPDPDRSGPAAAIVVDGVAYLFDCGPGVVRRAAAAAKLPGLAALAPEQIRYLFVTHLHSDHTVGYPDLLLTPWVTGRPWPLEVYGPPGLQKMTDALRTAYAEDVAIRSDAEHDLNGVELAHVHELDTGPIYQDAHVQITAVPVHHGTWPHAFAYRIVTADRTILITGDYAEPVEAVVAACNGCDVLVSEGYPTHLADGPRASYLHSFHTSAIELGVLATRARAKAVVVTHRRTGTDDVVRAEIQRNYAGTVILANDLDRI